ncbi:MAG TPA: TolC family protein [Fimbriimonadaceae bacterium]|nr:TolC family protein [Fimbriimonadaceae bacterium]
MRATFLCLAACGLVASVHSDETLTLDQALALGRQRNGTIVAALRELDVAKATLVQSKAGYYPSITASYGYSDDRIDDFKVPQSNPLRVSRSRGSESTISGSWTLLDTGERALGVRFASLGLDSQAYATQQTLRATLVDVYTRYVEALRAQELQKAAQAEVDRAQEVLSQAEAQAKVGEIAQKDVLQPRADALNAKVSFLGAQNATLTSRASLKAGIGWDHTKDLPELAPLQSGSGNVVEQQEQAVVASGLKDRPDLISERKYVDQLAVAVSQARLACGPTLNAGYTFTRQSGGFNDTGDSYFSLLVSYPLFDGYNRREEVRIAEADLASAKATLTQAEREAASEIESLFDETALDAQRIDAANLALEAAQTNFDKVYQAKQLGAQGADVVAVSTAQATLVTAETNAIQAQYDYAIAKVKLMLATGKPVPGEPS